MQKKTLKLGDDLREKLNLPKTIKLPQGKIWSCLQQDCDNNNVISFRASVGVENGAV